MRSKTKSENRKTSKEFRLGAWNCGAVAVDTHREGVFEQRQLGAIHGMHCACLWIRIGKKQNAQTSKKEGVKQGDGQT